MSYQENLLVWWRAWHAKLWWNHSSFFVEGICHHPKQFHVGVAFCSSWWQQTWWTKCVSKHLACPFPMTYFSSCEIQSHTNLLPKSLNIFYHFTFFNICVQPKKRFCLDMVSSPVPSGEDIKTKRHSWATQVLGADVQTRTLWDVCVGSFGNSFIIYIYTCCCILSIWAHEWRFQIWACSTNIANILL